jgi:uncharacterized membrane protein (DUF4010 family)
MGAVAPVAFASMALPIAAILAVSIIIAVAMFLWQPSGDAQMPEQKNPAELKPAFIFAGIYAVVVLAVAIAKEHFGSAGFYTVAIVSGLTDMDAITLSSARLVESGHTDSSTGWHAILIAAMSNFVFKFGTVSLLGHRLLTLRIGAVFGLILISGALVLWFWPA